MFAGSVLFPRLGIMQILVRFIFSGNLSSIPKPLLIKQTGQRGISKDSTTSTMSPTARCSLSQSGGITKELDALSHIGWWNSCGCLTTTNHHQTGFLAFATQGDHEEVKPGDTKGSTVDIFLDTLGPDAGTVCRVSSSRMPPMVITGTLRLATRHRFRKLRLTRPLHRTLSTYRL